MSGVRVGSENHDPWCRCNSLLTGNFVPGRGTLGIPVRTRSGTLSVQQSLSIIDHWWVVSVSVQRIMISSVILGYYNVFHHPWCNSLLTGNFVPGRGFVKSTAGFLYREGGQGP